MSERKIIAVIVASSIYNQKGLFNAVHNRVRYLKRIATYDIDVFLLSTYHGAFVSRLTGRKTQQRPIHFEKDGVSYHILWRKNSILDFVLYHKLHKRELFHSLYDKRTACLFKDYDLLDVHSGAGNLALQVNKQFGIPYIITWHGSDIHTSAYNSKSQYRQTKEMLESATYNCFVSSGLVNYAKKITSSFKYGILYNGANENFFKYDDINRCELRKKYGVAESKIVAFIGNLLEVKNPLSLPSIFEKVVGKYDGKVVFWIIGDGILRVQLEKQLKGKNLNYKAWGNQPVEKIPELLQCVDVVVLPSFKEGFGMVLVEAIKCGANAVASRVEGTKEILGEEDTFELNESFTEIISTRIANYLRNRKEQYLNPNFSWRKTAEKENEIVKSIIYHK